MIRSDLLGHTDVIWTLAWNPDGTILASSGADKTIKLWTKKNGSWSCVAVLTDSHTKSIRRLAWSPCGRYLASASFDSTICIWHKSADGSSWETLVNLEGHENEVKSVAWSHDGKYLATCGRDRTVWVWEGNGQEWDCSDIKNDHSRDVKNVLWHPNQNILVSCSYDDTVKFYQLNGTDWKCYETLCGHESTVWSMDFSPDGLYLATCSDDKTMRIWYNTAHTKSPLVESNSWKLMSTMKGFHSRSIYDVSWSKTSNLIATASGDNSIVIYKEEKDSYICVDKINQAHECDVNSVEWNPKIPNVLASAGDDAKITLWTLSEDHSGTRPLSLSDEFLHNLTEKFFKRSSGTESSAIEYEIQTRLTYFSTFRDLIQILNNFQNSLSTDTDKYSIEKLFDLSIKKQLSNPLNVTGLIFCEDNCTIDTFAIEIVDVKGHVGHRFTIKFETCQFKVKLPKRTYKIIVEEQTLFLLERSGDLFKLQPTGSYEFLLGHLFAISIVKILIRKNGSSYVLSADRDEKIRISRYPDSHNIERYCFGHSHNIKDIIVVDEARFISLDEGDYACLWNLEKLTHLANDQIFSPVRKERLGFSVAKRKNIANN